MRFIKYRKFISKVLIFMMFFCVSLEQANAGFLSSVGNFFKKAGSTVASGAKKVGQFVQSDSFKAAMGTAAPFLSMAPPPYGALLGTAATLGAQGNQGYLAGTQYEGPVTQLVSGMLNGQPIDPNLVMGIANGYFDQRGGTLGSLLGSQGALTGAIQGFMGSQNSGAGLMSSLMGGVMGGLGSPAVAGSGGILGLASSMLGQGSMGSSVGSLMGIAQNPIVQNVMQQYAPGYANIMYGNTPAPQVGGLAGTALQMAPQFMNQFNQLTQAQNPQQYIQQQGMNYATNAISNAVYNNTPQINAQVQVNTQNPIASRVSANVVTKSGVTQIKADPRAVSIQNQNMNMKIQAMRQQQAMQKSRIRR